MDLPINLKNPTPPGVDTASEHFFTISLPICISMHLKWTFVGFRGWRVHIPGGGGIRGRAIGIKAGRYDSGGEWDAVYRHWTRGGFKGDYGG